MAVQTRSAVELGRHNPSDATNEASYVSLLNHRCDLKSLDITPKRITVIRRMHNHRCVEAPSPDVLDHLKAINSRHIEVSKNEVVRIRTPEKTCQSVLSIDRSFDIKSDKTEDFGYRITKLIIVLHVENSRAVTHLENN